MGLSGEEWFRIIELTAGGALGTKILRVLITTRDNLRDTLKDVGTRQPPTGLFQSFNELQETVDQHHDYFVRSGLDRRQQERDRHDRR